MKFFFRAEGYKKGIVYSILFSAIAKLTAFLNIALIAYIFGTNGQSDVYFFILNAIQLISFLISVMESTVIIPESMRLREQVGKDESMLFVNYFFKLYFIIGIIVTIIIFINPLFLFSHFSGFNRALLSENKYLLYGSPLLLLLIIYSNLLSEVLSSYMYFTTPMIVNIINNITSVVFLLSTHKCLGILSVLLGLMIGYLINILFLVYHLISSLGWKFRFPGYSLTSAVKKNLLYAHIGNITGFIYNYFGLYLLSFLGTGVVSAMSYGKRLSDVPNHVICGQFSSVLGIKFNNEFARGDLVSLNNTLVRGLKILLFIVTPIATYSFLFSDNIIHLLLARGAFNAFSIKESSLFFKYFILCLPFIAINTVMARFFMSIQHVRFSSAIQILFAISNVILLLFLIHTYKEIGYVLSFLFSYFLITIIYLYINFRFIKYIDYFSVFIYLIKVFIINIILGYVVYSMIHILFHQLLWNLFFGFLFYFILLIFLNSLFSINTDIRFFIIEKLKKIIL
ncbi:MAG: hypothetical protein IMW88_09650 [Thermoflavifilum sp.]|uniref:lipid II flippase MurJ n=1 Tax=Thermoflavifilum sp. TaxID=1968839 RepID=UPI0018A5F82B|nr:lipid II flippase MurJ [Thermoflavifilum sp.]QOR75595.1 MAG: hypothetical protein IMW88_09650 [Thermoflavifilum sp.]